MIDGKVSLIATNKDRKLAIINYQGWDSLELNEHNGLHPESKKSTLLYSEYEDEDYLHGPV